MGYKVTPLVFVEVNPLEMSNNGSRCNQSSHRDCSPCLSAPRVKMLLRRKTLVSTVSSHESVKLMKNTTGNKESSSTLSGGNDDPNVGLTRRFLSFPSSDSSDLRWARLQRTGQIVPVVRLPSEDPTVIEPVLCCIVGYHVTDSLEPEEALDAIITDTTLVRILPVEAVAISTDPHSPEEVPLDLPTCRSSENWKCIMTGESSHSPLSSESIAEVFHNHDPETIRALTLRMAMLQSQPVVIGTTADAFVRQQRYQSRERVIRVALDSYLSPKESNTHLPQPKNEAPSRSVVNNAPGYLREGALVVHSPNHGAGKTLLARAIAQERLKCDAIHIVEPTLLLSQFGIHADSALESLLHSIVMSAACQQESICIILDHLDAMLPLSSSRASAGDAAMPVVKAMGELSLCNHRIITLLYVLIYYCSILPEEPYARTETET